MSFGPSKLRGMELVRGGLGGFKIPNPPRFLVSLADPIGSVNHINTISTDLTLFRVSVPIGALLCIFESRPDVIVQIGCLSIKSGNACLLKGGKEASRTNKILCKCMNEALKEMLFPSNCVFLLVGGAFCGPSSWG